MRETATVGSTRREQLVQAALEAIEQHGPTVGMAQIAERAGVARPHVYRVITSKDELDAEVGRRAADAFVNRVRRALARAGGPEEQAHASIAAAVAWAADHPNLYRFLAARQHARATTSARRGRFLDELVRVVEGHDAADGQPAGLADAVLAGIIGLVDASIIWWLDHRDESQDEVVARLAGQVILIGRSLSRPAAP